MTGHTRDPLRRCVAVAEAELPEPGADSGPEPRGEFGVDDPAPAARAVFDATLRFNSPRNASEWTAPDTDQAFDAVPTLILHGLSRNHP